MTRRAIGGHHSARTKTVTWLTPPRILAALGSFDLDPCAAPLPRPWPTARVMNSIHDGDGLVMQWFDRVYLNPPYTSAELENWLCRLADHGRGTALIFARTETAAFRRQVWDRATGMLFIHGRLHFHRLHAPRPERCQTLPHSFIEYEPKAFACEHCGMAQANSGAPSVLCAYGQDDLDQLAASSLDGTLVPLRFARFVAIAGVDGSWAQVVQEWLRQQRGPVSVSDAYRHFARHPKAARNQHWRAKVRQKLQRVGRRVGPAQYMAAA